MTIVSTSTIQGQTAVLSMATPHGCRLPQHAVYSMITQLELLSTRYRARLIEDG
jgi:hypothetical protein